MKVAGSLLLALGLLAAAALALVPVSVTIFGEEGSCSAPVVRVVSQQESADPNAQALIDLCEERSWPRVLWALAVGSAGSIVGLALLVRSGRGPDDHGP